MPRVGIHYLMPTLAPAARGASNLLLGSHLSGFLQICMPGKGHRPPPGTCLPGPPGPNLLSPPCCPLLTGLAPCSSRQQCSGSDVKCSGRNTGPGPPWLHWGCSQMACTGMGHRQAAATMNSCLGWGVGLAGLSWRCGAWGGGSCGGFPPGGGAQDL